MPAEVGAVVQGNVTGIMPFGAFVRLEDGRMGLVHISEVANEYVKDLNQYLKEGQTVKVKIIAIDKGDKIKLSIKKAQDGPPREARSNRNQSTNNNAPSFEDRLAKFLKDSDERIQDLKKNFESKRGKEYKRSAQ